MSFRVSFCSCVFSPFSFAITLLGEERANLSAFRMFVRFVLVWICRSPLPLVGGGGGGGWGGAVCDCGTPWTFLLPFFYSNVISHYYKRFKQIVNRYKQGGYCLGPVVQSIVSLTSLLVVKMLTVLVRTISNSQVFC